jgi:hypothetical protein
MDSLTAEERARGLDCAEDLEGELDLNFNDQQRTLVGRHFTEAIRQAEAAEREACAAVCDDWLLCPEDEEHDNSTPQQGDGTSHNKACRYLAKAIRARGKE